MSSPGFTSLTGLARRLRGANSNGAAVPASAPAPAPRLSRAAAVSSPALPLAAAQDFADPVPVGDAAGVTPEGSFYEEGADAGEVAEMFESETGSQVSARPRGVREPRGISKTVPASSAHVHEQFTRRSASSSLVWPAAGGVAAAVLAMRFLPDRVPTWFRDSNGNVSDARVKSFGFAAGVVTFFVIRFFL